jgi:hypothetical protein
MVVVQGGEHMVVVQGGAQSSGIFMLMHTLPTVVLVSS